MLQNGNYLLDTNIIVAMFAGDRTIHEKVRNSDEVFVSATVMGELRFGAEKSTKVAENHRRIDLLARQIKTLPCNLETAYWYGVIRDKLRRKGHPIPDNDIWIAAIAMQHGLTVVTRDAHFEEIEALPVQHW